MANDTNQHKPVPKSARQQRLGQALRENLKRRKQQIRGRASQDASDTAAEAAGVAVPEQAEKHD